VGLARISKHWVALRRSCRLSIAATARPVDAGPRVVVVRVYQGDLVAHTTTVARSRSGLRIAELREYRELIKDRWVSVHPDCRHGERSGYNRYSCRCARWQQGGTGLPG
jgi:hypothetical protein